MRKEIQQKITFNHTIICVTCIGSVSVMDKRFWQLKKDLKNIKDAVEE
jgi:hypothetical protein